MAVHRLLFSPPSATFIMVSKRSNPDATFQKGMDLRTKSLALGPCGAVRTGVNGSGTLVYTLSHLLPL